MRKLLILITLFLCFSSAGYAEEIAGPGSCSGAITGTNVELPPPTANPNAGIIDADAHEGSGTSGEADVSIMTGNPSPDMQLVPISFFEAACVQDDKVEGDDFYELSGWLWSDNIGYISLKCEDGKNEGIDCGPHDYGIKVNFIDSGSVSGYAWNEVFGYIQLNIDHSPSGVYVNMLDDDTGVLSGSGWSEAEVWVNFAGIEINKPIEEPPEPPYADFCDGAPWVCFEVLPEPLEINGEERDIFSHREGSIDGYVVANGIDGYRVHMFLRDENGVDPMDLTKYELSNIQFHWKDTVKRNQISGAPVGTSLDDNSAPWFTTTNGAILRKPISPNFVYPPVGDMHGAFKRIGPELEYTLGEEGSSAGLITSYAPTTSGNYSLTTSTDKPFLFNNEIFVNDIGIEVEEPNNLKLEYITFDLTDLDTGLPARDSEGKVVPTIVYPNRNTNLNLAFRPAIEVDTLYKDVLEDQILAVRGTPMNLTIGAREVTYSGVDWSAFVPSSPRVNFILAYAEDNLAAICDPASNIDYNFEFIDDGTTVKQLLDDIGLGGKIDYSAELTIDGDPASACDEVGGYSEKEFSESLLGPTAYTEVAYDLGPNTVFYYSIKLPRLASYIASPLAIIHGNIYAPRAFSPSEQQIQETGEAGGASLRRSVDKNISKYLRDWDNKISNSDGCEIINLNVTDSSPNVLCGASDNYYAGDAVYFSKSGIAEKILYFTDDTDVTIDLGSDLLRGNWVIVMEGGQLRINSDLWHIGDQSLAIVHQRKFGEEKKSCEDGNVYIDNDVKNIGANIVSDCPIFSWDADSGMALDADGLPIWSGFADRVNTLNKQLFINGSIYSRNTIGGSELDKDPDEPEDFILLGTGDTYDLPVSEDERLEAQQYDLNYMRLFRLGLERDESGLPVDQQCGMPLSIEDNLEIKAYKDCLLTEGNPLDCSDDGLSPVKNDEGDQCDGLNTEYAYDPGIAPFDLEAGDLVIPEGDERVATGLPEESYEPVYIFYKPTDSFIFEQSD